MFLLQITNDAVSATNQSMPGSELTLSGLLILIPIILLFILVIYLLVDRLMVLNKANKNPDQFMAKVKVLVLKGDINGARALCGQYDTPVARMIEKGVSRIGTPLRNIEAAIESVGKIQLFRLEKNLPVLATVAGAAPMLGFLGTVLGMVEAFKSISHEEGFMSPQLLSSGMFTAMITTVAGLAVGIVAYTAYNYLVTRVKSIVHKMEYTSIDFIELLQEPRS